MNKSKALGVIKESLNKIGYDDEKIIKEYPITTRDENIIYFDFIAFGHNKIQDTSTSCISIKYCDDDNYENKIIEYAKYSASPFLIISKKEKVKLCKLNVEKKLDNIIELQYDELCDYFSQNRVKYDYSKIVSSKNNSEQISLFDSNNLFMFASKINCELLGKEFKKAIYSVKDLVDSDDTEQVEDVTSIVMHIIAAKILNDKLVLGKRITNLHELLNELSNKYGDYFDKGNLYKYGAKLIDTIGSSFSKEFSYRSIDNKILGNFYESTLFESDESKNKKMKRDWGIYYTPSCIVNNMLKAMPIELIDYRKRYILDASCGSGSLLIGAYNRLKQLLPAKMNEELQHQYLTNMIMGIDIDKFACEVARLELLLNSIPYGNGWTIRSEDFLKINNMSFRPNIIIANPPYEEKRKDKKLIQKANLFLEKYIDILNDEGLIGIVLPQTFLVNKSCKEARKKLLTNIQIHEVWLLPKGVFDTNNCATTVILGRKQKNINNKAFKGKVVVQKSVSRFKKMGKFDFEFICKNQVDFLDEKDYKIIVSPVKEIIAKLEIEKTIKDYTNDTQGIQIPYNKYPLISDVYINGYKKYFRNARKGISRYRLNWNEQTKSKFIFYDPENDINLNFIGKKDKGLRLRASKRDILESKKVIMPINSTPGTFWRVKAAIDYEGIYVSHSLWCFVPKDNNISLEVIAGVLNSKITSLYLENHNLEMSLNSTNIRNIPFPKLTINEMREIEECVKRIEVGIDIQKNSNIIDYILYEAFKLDKKDIYIIENYYSIYNGFRIEENEEDDKDTVKVTGNISSIDINSNVIKATFVECDEEKIINIDNQIPGWLLTEKCPFTCDISESDFYEKQVNIANIKPLQYSYLSDSDISNLVANSFNDYNYDVDKIKYDIAKEEA